VRFVVYEVALEQVFLRILRLSPASIIPFMLNIHSGTMLGMDNRSVSGRSSTAAVSPRRKDNKNILLYFLSDIGDSVKVFPILVTSTGTFLYKILANFPSKTTRQPRTVLKTRSF
jgi:hypothetical protein